MKIHVSVFAALLLFACQSSPQQEKEPAGHSGSEVLQAPYAAVFYDSLQLAMDTYYDLSEALVKASATWANKSAGLLKQHIDSLPLHVLQMDSTRLEQVRISAGSISAELAGLTGEPELEGKRESFQMVSDMLFDLVKTTGLKGKTIYRHYCPMAFNDRGAYWLSNNTTVVNPYFGNDMLHCGEVTDTLRY